MTYRSVSNDRICDIRKYSPDVAHASTISLGPSCTGNDITLTSIETTNKCPHARPSNMINRNTVFFQCSYEPLSVYRQPFVASTSVSLLTRWAIPRAPPPPRTRPIDRPQIRLASLKKSLACGWRRGRISAAPRRYF